MTKNCDTWLAKACLSVGLAMIIVFIDFGAAKADEIVQLRCNFSRNTSPVTTSSLVMDVSLNLTTQTAMLGSYTCPLSITPTTYTFTYAGERQEFKYVIDRVSAGITIDGWEKSVLSNCGLVTNFNACSWDVHGQGNCSKAEPQV